MKRIDAAIAQQIEDKFAEEVRTQSADRSTVRQRKTGHPVQFELSERTREAVDDYIRPPQEGVAKSSSQPTPAGVLLDDPPAGGRIAFFRRQFSFSALWAVSTCRCVGRATAPAISRAFSMCR